MGYEGEYTARGYDPLGAVALRVEKRRAEQVRHGLTCEKAPHVGDGHLHAEEDDSQYDVDGQTYCGRCHICL